MTTRLVCATTLTERMFWRASYLGRSLSLIPVALRPELTLHPSNTGSRGRGLATLYNAAIDDAAAGDVLILVHDDVYLHDWYVDARAHEAMRAFDIVGVAGAVDPDLSQPGWSFAFDEDFKRLGLQSGTRSGAINHFDYVHHDVQVFGPAPAACRLLDGVLMIVSVDRLRETGVRFDERFAFHLYDLDFCRAAAAGGLRVGTWPIAVTHDSTGGYGSKGFKAAAREYLDKWRGQP